MEEDKSEKQVLPGDEAFTLLFDRLSEEAKVQTAQVMLKIMICSLADLPGVVMLYDGEYMHIHGLGVTTEDARHMISEIAKSFALAKAAQGGMH